MDTLSRPTTDASLPLIDLVEFERLVTADDLLLFDRSGEGDCDLHAGCQPIG
jgi:hypothetical protein